LLDARHESVPLPPSIRASIRCRAESRIASTNRAKAQAYRHRAGASQRRGDFAQAIADYQTLLKLNLQDASALNYLARLCVTGPSEHSDPCAALPLAEAAVRLALQDANYLNTLGVVYYRLDRFDQAIATLLEARSAKLAGRANTSIARCAGVPPKPRCRRLELRN
jgi:tetratricopeptide (TPR) repeat protein